MEMVEVRIGRFPDGRLKVTVHYQNSSNFRQCDLSECLRFDDEELKLEVLSMVDQWNRVHHKEFQQVWRLIRNDGSKEKD